ALAERIRQAIAEQRVWLDDRQHHIQVTGSIGVATHDASRTVEESLGIADKAMYEAKALGRNRVVVLD
ncbi:MAG: diguanylate cyclase, partial [Pseudomonas sp.]|nr:diguanylate cyclase [Pseudomonas sp.]